MFQLENSGNLPDFSSPVPITYWDAVYFLMVTMSTVGEINLLISERERIKIINDTK